MKNIPIIFIVFLFISCSKNKSSIYTSENSNKINELKNNIIKEKKTKTDKLEILNDVDNKKQKTKITSFRETKKADKEFKNEIVPYPFDHCAVSRKPFRKEGHKHRRVYKKHEVLLCCDPCLKAFDYNPEPFMPRIIEKASSNN